MMNEVDAVIAGAIARGPLSVKRGGMRDIPQPPVGDRVRISGVCAACGAPRFVKREVVLECPNCGVDA